MIACIASSREHLLSEPIKKLPKRLSYLFKAVASMIPQKLTNAGAAKQFAIS